MKPVPIGSIEPDSSSADAVWNALEAWAGREMNPVRGEHQPVSNAIRSWEQDPPMPDGTVWHEAVVRCCKAAQRGGTKFGDHPRYAITVVNRLLAAWRAGTPPEPTAASYGGGNAKQREADEQAEQDEAIRLGREETKRIQAARAARKAAAQ